MKLNKFFAVLTSLVLCFAIMLQVSAATSLEDLQDEYDRLDGEIADLQDDINELNKDKKTQQAAKAKLLLQVLCGLRCSVPFCDS